MDFFYGKWIEQSPRIGIAWASFPLLVDTLASAFRLLLFGVLLARPYGKDRQDFLQIVLQGFFFRLQQWIETN